MRELSELISIIQTSTLLKVRTSYLCEVITFYPETQTVDVKPLIKKYIASENGTIRQNVFGQYVRMESILEEPILGVPVKQIRGSDFSITFPLSPGDVGVLEVIADDITLWKESGGEQNPLNPMPFDINSCVFDPFIPNAITKDTNFSKNCIEIKSKNATIKIDNNGIEIKGDTVKIDGNVEMTGDMKITGDLTVEGSSINLTGETNITGNLTVSGNITGAGVSASGTIGGGAITSGGKEIKPDHTHSYVDTQPNGTPVTKQTGEPE